MSRMSLFAGIHEVRAVSTRGTFAGYFSDEAMALAAVSRLEGYTAAWATLNPLRADAITADTVINPDELERTYRAATDAHIARRAWLLLDFDGARPDTSQPSTDTEKAGAHQQAEQCRDELRALGWSAPTVIDSGNGWHLRYRIHLPNDAAAHDLVRSVLYSLATRYPALDVTNHNASRLAKFPGSWARKGTDTPERPHRQSRLVEASSDAMVSEAQLRALVPHTATGRVYTYTPEEVTSDEAKAAREWLLGYAEHHALPPRTEARRITGGWKLGISCPLTETDAQPHDEAGETSTVLQIINGRVSFKCSHNTCEKHGRKTAVFKREMFARHGPFKREPGDIAVAIGKRR